MRMVRAQNEVVNGETVETKQAGVGGDAKIVFAILTGMVTNKIEYCLREPGTNAWEANRKQPFELTLPTIWNATIRFRDFGSGLSHRFMMDRYAKIGESTKDGSDDEVGGWGFGSKSPLAYLMRQDGAGAYGVVSRYRGVRRAYSIGINTAGKIQITFMGEQPMDDTDRGTGLEVSFPVREEDIERFRTTADRVFWGFNPQPVVLPRNADAPALGRGLVKATGSGWTLYADSKLPWSGPHVRLGPVLYPVRLDLLDGLTGFLNQSDNLLIEAQIGSLDVSTSREALSYTDLTKATLSQLFQDYEQGLVADIQTKVDTCANYFDAARVAYKGCQALGWERARMLFGRISWSGIRLQEQVFHDASTAAPVRAMRIGGRHGWTQSFKAEAFESQAASGCRLLVEHSSYRSIERLEHAGVLTDGQPCLWIRVRRADLDVLHRMLGVGPDDYTVLDDIKLPKRDVKSGTPTKIRVRRQFDHKGQLTNGPVDLLAGGLYVRMDRVRRSYHASINLNGLEYDCDTYKTIRVCDFDDFLKAVKTAGLLPDDRPIILIKPDDDLSDDWQSLAAYLDSEIAGCLDHSKLTPRIKWDDNSFSSTLTKSALFNLDHAPAALVDLVQRMRHVLGTSGKGTEPTHNEHDALLDLQVRMLRKVTVPTVTDPSIQINEEWDNLMGKHAAINFYLSERYLSQRFIAAKGRSEYVVDPSDQRLFDYFCKIDVGA